MTSSSRLLPPGWITARMPYPAATSRLSRNGRNASEAMTEPATVSSSSVAFIAARRVEYTRLIWPAPTPMVAPARANTMALDFTNLHTAQANRRSASSAPAGLRGVGTAGALACRQARPIARLRQQSSADAAQLKFTAGDEGRLPGQQHPHVRLAGQHARGRGVHGGCGQHFDELALDNRGRGGCVELAVEGDDAAVRGGRIGTVGSLVGVEGWCRQRRPAGVGVLDDDTGGLREQAHALDGGIRVRNVVVRKVLALQDARTGHACTAPVRVAVQRRALVRIFPVAQVLHFLEQE